MNSQSCAGAKEACALKIKFFARCFLWGVISLNIIAAFPAVFLSSERSAFFYFLILLLSDIILFFLIFACHRKAVRSVDILDKSAREHYEQAYLANQRTCNHEDELMKKNEELAKMNQNYMETTKKLFERETELTRANKRLQELDEVKSEFVSVAAHQLRTPMTGIKWSYLALLEKETGSLNGEQKKIVEQGLENINYSIDLINDLLNTARLEEGKVEFTFARQSITPIIREIVSQHEPLAKEKNIELDIEYPPDSSPPLWIDKEKIWIVFDNILANAVKYTPQGGRITLRHMRKGKEMHFKIKDTGIGIPAKDISNVFSKFFRSRNAVSFQTSGSGLGLYVVKKIVEKHGGKIELESIEKKGTTVIFTLPIKET